MGWEVIVTAIVAFVLGNIIKPLFGEITKDLYKHCFKGGKQEKEVVNDKELLLKFLRDREGQSFITQELHQLMLNNQSIDYVSDLLHEISKEKKVISDMYFDNKTYWQYFRSS